MALRNGFFAVGLFGLYPIFSRKLEEQNVKGTSNIMLTGLLTAFCSSSFTMPLDNIATQRQSIGAKIGPKRKNVEIISHILKTNGFRGLFVGGSMRFMMSFLEITCFNEVKKFYEAQFP